MTEDPKVLAVLATSNKLYARFLRYLMGSRFHHAFIVVNISELGGWLAIDVDRNGPHMISTRKAFEEITDFECIQAKENLFKGIAVCRDYMGSGYDHKGAWFGVFILCLKRLFGIKPKNTVQDPFKMYCIEYVASVLRYSDVRSFKDLNVSNLSTLDFHDLIDSDSTLSRFTISKKELLNG